jgi:hypothetical protein
MIVLVHLGHCGESADKCWRATVGWQNISGSQQDSPNKGQSISGAMPQMLGPLSHLWRQARCDNRGIRRLCGRL